MFTVAYPDKMKSTRNAGEAGAFAWLRVLQGVTDVVDVVDGETSSRTAHGLDVADEQVLLRTCHDELHCVTDPGVPLGETADLAHGVPGGAGLVYELPRFGEADASERGGECSACDAFDLVLQAGHGEAGDEPEADASGGELALLSQPLSEKAAADIGVCTPDGGHLSLRACDNLSTSIIKQLAVYIKPMRSLSWTGWE